jgi:putative sterol carrier protein
MKYLSQEFLDEAARISQGFADRPNANARIQYLVSGGPEGDISYYWVVVGGKLQEARLGELPDADFSLRMSYDTSVKIQQGEMNPNVAFMTGKMKASGNVGKLLSLMPLTQSDDFKSLQEQLRTNSEF